MKSIHVSNVPFVFYWVRKWKLNRSAVRTRQIISGGGVSTHLYSVAGGVGGGCGACELICPLDNIFVPAAAALLHLRPVAAAEGK